MSKMERGGEKGGARKREETTFPPFIIDERGGGQPAIAQKEGGGEPAAKPNATACSPTVCLCTVAQRTLLGARDSPGAFWEDSTFTVQHSTCCTESTLSIRWGRWDNHCNFYVVPASFSVC